MKNLCMTPQETNTHMCDFEYCTCVEHDKHVEDINDVTHVRHLEFFVLTTFHNNTIIHTT